MKACTKCGEWHTRAEEHMGKALSCTQVKEYWSGVSLRHKEICGHYAQIRIRKNGQIICMTCMQDLDQVL